MSHSSDQPSKEVNLYCEECEQILAALFCRQCDQRICRECDKKIHNKGKRAMHKRVALERQLKSIGLLSDIRTELVSTEAYSSPNLTITYAQKICCGNLDTDVSKMKEILARYYLYRANEGELMHELEAFKTTIYDIF
jgi:B-box zinc finger